MLHSQDGQLFGLGCCIAGADVQLGYPLSLRGSGLGGFGQPKMGRSGMVGGRTNLDLLHVAASCHMLCMLHYVALSCRRRLRRYRLLKGRDCLFIRFVIRYLPTNIGVAFHDPF